VVARELDLAELAVRRWVQQAEVDAGRGRPGALTTEEREELGRLANVDPWAGIYPALPPHEQFGS